MLGIISGPRPSQPQAQAQAQPQAQPAPASQPAGASPTSNASPPSSTGAPGSAAPAQSSASASPAAPTAANSNQAAPANTPRPASSAPGNGGTAAAGSPAARGGDTGRPASFTIQVSAPARDPRAAALAAVESMRLQMMVEQLSSTGNATSQILGETKETDDTTAARPATEQSSERDAPSAGRREQGVVNRLYAEF